MTLRIFIFSLILISFKTTLMGQSFNTEIDNFQKGKLLDWMIVNDGVMGGRSSSDLELVEDGIARFFGNVSLENYGGFASTRALIEDNLTGIKKIVIRVKGDGNVYEFRIRTNNRFDGVSYKTTFETIDGEWTTHELMLADFLPTFRGRILTDVAAIDASEIRQIGFLIANKQEGDFELFLDWIKGI